MGVTTETKYAEVTVTNATGAPIGAVSVVHKYSSVYKEHHQWGVLLDGQKSEGKSVAYHVGAFTTGKDWWVVSWFSEDGTTQYVSAPNNFRNIIDELESVGPSATGIVAGAIAAAVTCAGGPSAAAAGVVAAGVASEATKHLFNGESTVGFKQHILREEDAGCYVDLRLNGDGTIVISSPSGVSETVYESKQL
eukprot:contig_13486_g3234